MGEQNTDNPERTPDSVDDSEGELPPRDQSTKTPSSLQEASPETMRLPRRSLLQDINVKRDLAHLRIEIGPHEPGQKFRLDENTVTIGRSPDCELQLDLLNISRQHARIVYEGEEYYVEDLNSTNGTLLNGLLVSKSVLRNGDVVEIGEAKLTFVEEGTA